MDDPDSSSSQRESLVSSAKDIKERLEQRLRNSLQEALQNEGTILTVPDQEIQDLACFLFGSMATLPRLYHGPDHVLEVLQYYERELLVSSSSDKGDPISILAILFHDIIYYTLDKKLSPRQSTVLKDIILEEQHGLTLLPFSRHQNPVVSMVATVFGRNENEALPTLGMNEFLSALIATQILSPYLSDQQLLQLAVGIEATIPFRPTMDQETGGEKTPMESLYDRAVDAIRKLGGRSLEDNDSTLAAAAASVEVFVNHAVQQAVIIAHSDLGVFSDPDPTRYVDSTWRLLPEWFPSLLLEGPKERSLEQFQSILATLQKRQLDPHLIYPSFQSVPSPAALQHKLESTKRNQDLLHRYLSIRLVTVTTILELMALSAVETPSGVILETLESALNGVLIIDESEESSVWNDGLDEILFQVLKVGRRQSYSWDGSKSLLSALIFEALRGSQGVYKTLEHSISIKGYETNTGDTTCLRQMPKDVAMRAARALTTALPSVEYDKIFEAVDGWP